MARSKISSVATSVLDDNGGVLLSVVKGEQPHVEVTLDWLTDILGFNIHANIIEAENDGGGGIPTTVKQGGVRRLLTKANGYIRGVDDGNNIFTIVIPYDISAGLDPQPSPDASVYMYFDVEVGEYGTGDDAPIGDSAVPSAQIWKPIRGLIEILYSPTEEL